MPDPLRLLIADDNATIRQFCRFALQDLNCAVTEAADCEEAIGALAADAFDVNRSLGIHGMSMWLSAEIREYVRMSSPSEIISPLASRRSSPTARRPPLSSHYHYLMSP